VQDSHYVLNTIQGPFRNYERDFLNLLENIRSRESVEEVLSSPELAKHLAKLDKRFEERLKKVED
jgi:hypothetical protein